MIEDTTTLVKETRSERKSGGDSKPVGDAKYNGADKRISAGVDVASTRQYDSVAEPEAFQAPNDPPTVKLTAVTEAPGKILRRARERKGLEQIEIARELKLDVALIDALERGDLNRLPPVYAAGYIRAYAKRVDLDADELVTEYIAQEAKHTPKLKKNTNPLPERYRRVAEALPKSFSLAAANAKEQLTKNYGPLAAGIVILLLLVWQVFSIWSSDDAATGTDIVALQSKEDASMAMPSEQEQNDSLNAQLATQAAPAMTATTASSTGSVAKGSDKNAEPSTLLNQAKSENSVASSTINPTTTAQGVPQAETQSSETIDAIAMLEKSNSTDLVLTFNRNSWVDIRDATGKHIIRQLGIAGNTQRVSGQAPFQVLLGYGHGVTIEYNGNEVDFSAFQGDRVARFTLEVPKKKIVTQ